MTVPASPWALAGLAAALLAIDPRGLGGLHVKAGAGPVRERFLNLASGLMGGPAPRRVPPGISQARLTGGLDIGRTLDGGRPVIEDGVLAGADGGTLLLPMAERLSPSVAATIAMAMDTGMVPIERDGLSATRPARFAVIALDEAGSDEEPLAPLLADRMGLHIGLDGIGWRETDDWSVSTAQIAEARQRLAGVEKDELLLPSLCALAGASRSMRAALFLLRAARASSALRAGARIEAQDAALAVLLVLGPSAFARPEEEAAQDDPPPAQPPPDQPPQESGDDSQPSPEMAAEMLVKAAQASLPQDLLARLASASVPRSAASDAGRAGVPDRPGTRGRAIGIASTPPLAASRIDVPATLRAAAPWQRLRRTRAGLAPGRPIVRKDDFQYLRIRQKAGTLAVFAVDASGSAAIERLAEAKGAVELLLAQCYVRRDSVALIAFRGTSATTLLEPTRSLVRAKRALAGLPGGGATPLAGGLMAALTLAGAARRRGQRVTTVVLTDGRGNIALDGTADRERAADDTQRAARLMRASGLPAILIDTATRPQARAEDLARVMGAEYLALPRAGAASLARAIDARMAS